MQIYPITPNIWKILSGKIIISYVRVQNETKCDIVTGTRYINGGGVYGWNPLRKIISRGANFISTFLLRPVVSDLTGSYRLYKKEIFDELMNVITNSGYAFQTEVIIRAQYKGYKICEVPIAFVDRLMGLSKLGFNEIITYFKTVFDLYLTL